MRSLVIGASGLVGSHVARELERSGPVTGTSTTVAPFARLDIRDRDATLRLVREARPDVVVCAAAQAYVEECERDPAGTAAINVGGLANVAEAARGAGAVLVYFSSDYVFDGEAGPYAEDDPVRPINEYGRQKVSAERIVASLPASLVCRTSGVFGVEVRRNNFALQVVDRLRAGAAVTAAADQILCPTPAAALAAALRDLLVRGTRGIVHVVGPEALTRADFARRVARAFGLDERSVRGLPTDALGLVAPRPRNTALRDDRLRALLGRSLPPLDEALRDLCVSA